MLEPGELPVMRELPALKKKQGLKDPFLMRASSKSPLLRASPSPSNLNTVNSPLQRVQGKEWEDQCKDFYTAPEAHKGKTKADMRLSWDMSKEALFELDSTHEEHQSIIEHFDRWRVSGEGHVICETSSITSNSSEEAEEEDHIYPSLRYQRHNIGLAKPSQRISKSKASSRHSVSMFSSKMGHQAHQAESMRDRYSWHAGRRATKSRRNGSLATSFATKRAAHTSPIVSASWQQAPRERELMESEMHSLELLGSMTVKSQVTKPRLAKGSNASRRKSAHQSPRRSQKVSKSSVLEKGPSAKSCHWSELQDDYESDVSTTSSSVDGHGCDGFSQNESCEDNKPRHRKQAQANCLQLAVTDRKDLVVKEDKPRSLSQKYRPRVFGEIFGQHIVVQSLSNAILKGRIVPVYLFQGPRGTGKTSAARIFAAALLCIVPQDQRPCGHCNVCASVRSGKNAHVKEVDAASSNGIAKVKVLLEEVTLASASSHYKVFIIDECHVLTTETWNALLRILEEPPMNVVFILITTDPDQLPRTAMSRCQKFPFPKIKDAEIIRRLVDLTSRECIKLDLEVLKLIASRSDGSLRDAEMILDQLSLLGQEINSSTVHELVGSASEGRILSLLDSALLADTVNTTKKARELVDSGVQPLSLMSHMATLIIDILAGSYQFTEEQRRGFFHRQTLSEEKLERLRKAVNTLSEAEKQLRVSKDKMAWLIAALLQLGPDRSCMFPASGSGTSITQSPNTLVDVDHGVTDIECVSVAQRCYQSDVDHGGMDIERVSLAQMHYQGDVDHGVMDIERTSVAQRRYLGDVESSSVSIKSHTSTKRTPLADGQVSSDRPMIQSDVRVKYNLGSSNLSLGKATKESSLTPEDIDDIWSRVVQICRPFRLRQSLHGHGKLVSISLLEGSAVVHLEFIHPKHKTQCERSWENISSVFEEVLGCPVEVIYSLVSENGIRQPCNSSEQNVCEDFISKGTTYSPDYAVTMQSSGGLAHYFLPNDIQSYSVTSQVPSGCTLKDIQCLRARSSESNVNTLEQVGALGSNRRIYNATSCMGIKEHSMEATLLSSEEQLDQAWICDDEERSSSSSDAVNMSNGELTNQNGGCHAHREALPQDKGPHGRACEDVIEIVELDALSSYSRTFGLRDDPEEENRTMSGGLEGCTALGSTSSEKKGSTLKAMQRLAFRGWNRSLTENYQPSTEDQEGTAFAISESQRNSQSSNNDSSFSGDVSEHFTKAGSRMLSAPLLKNKLRGAAENVVRFFQGKLSRNSQDTFVQCI